MPERVINCIIEPDGTVKMDAVGFQGSACQVATAPFLQALGGDYHSQPKPELRQQQTLTQGQGQ